MRTQRDHMMRLASGLLAVAVSGSAGELVAAQEPEFDINRARVGAGSRFEPFRVRQTQSLRQALVAGVVESDTRLLVMEHAAGRLALLTDQMAYHHVAQGDIAGEPWMVSF